MVNRLIRGTNTQIMCYLTLNLIVNVGQTKISKNINNLQSSQKSFKFPPGYFSRTANLMY